MWKVLLKTQKSFINFIKLYFAVTKTFFHPSITDFRELEKMKGYTIKFGLDFTNSKRESFTPPKKNAF
jgi:hypothetical protein